MTCIHGAAYGWYFTYKWHSISRFMKRIGAAPAIYKP
jgi:hypothetical protein